MADKHAGEGGGREIATADAYCTAATATRVRRSTLMGSRTAVLAALLSSLGIVAVVGVAAAQSVPLPVPAPQPKSFDRPAAQQPPPANLPSSPIQQSAGAPQQQAANSSFPSIFPKPPDLFGKAGEATAFNAKQRALADRVSAYLSSVRQLHGNFVQVGPDGSKSEGEFYMQKPGKVRFDYNPPSPIELIADGQSVVVRDRKLATQDLYPLSQTPLRFLLSDHLDLLRDTNLVGVYADDVFVTVVIEERQILGGTHRVMLMFGAQDFQLRQWTVTDPQGYDTTVAVYNLDTKQQADPSMFRIDYTRNIQ
jgi:outer membrane lipoprotein-sorting protein